MATKASAWQVSGFLERLLRDGRAYSFSQSEDGVIETIVWLMDGGDGEVLYNASQVCIFDNTFNES